MNMKHALDHLLFVLNGVDPAEKCVAIHIASNPQEVSEFWHLVGDENMGMMQLAAIHQAIPCSVIAKVKPLLERVYGKVDEVGFTSCLDPHFIGVKRMCPSDRKAAEDNVRSNFTREGYIQYLRDQMNKENHDAMGSLIAMVPQFSEEEFQALIKDEIDERIQENVYETPEHEAIAQAVAYYQMSFTEEKVLRQQSLDQVYLDAANLRKLALNR